jgi:hypothetical protein
MRALAVAVTVCLLGAVRTAAADYVNGAADDVRAAEAVVIGRVQTTAD